MASRISGRLAEGKDVMLGIAITEQGFAMGELAADDEVAEVIGMAVTDTRLVSPPMRESPRKPRL